MAEGTEQQVAKATRPRYRVTPRDIAILYFISQDAFATGKEIGAKFFGNLGSHLYLRRLRKLQKMGLIAPLLGDQGVRLGYVLTGNGRMRLENEGIAVKLGRRVGRYRSTYEHDVKLHEIRRILEGSPLVSDFRTEAELRSEAAKRLGRRLSEWDLLKVPDGSFTLKCPSRVLKVALELELAAKSEQRYRRMLRALCTIPDHDCVFIIAGQEVTKDRLAALLRDMRLRDPKVLAFGGYRGMYFGLLSDVLSRGIQAHFYGEGKSFTLEELAAA